MIQKTAAVSEPLPVVAPIAPAVAVAAPSSVAPHIEVVSSGSVLDQNLASATLPTPEAVPNAKYTIAHIIYLRKDQAAKEADKIKGKGYDVRVIPSGKYYQICVGGYASRKDANEGMKLLQGKGIVSSDSYIRNIPTA